MTQMRNQAIQELELRAREHPTVKKLTERMPRLYKDNLWWTQELPQVPEGKNPFQTRRARAKFMRTLYEKHMEDDLQWAIPSGSCFETMGLQGAAESTTHDAMNKSMFNNILFWEVFDDFPIPDNNRTQLNKIIGWANNLLEEEGMTPTDVEYKLVPVNNLIPGPSELSTLGGMAIGAYGRFIVTTNFAQPTIVHEVMHCNSYGIPAQALNEGVTELLTCDAIAKELGGSVPRLAQLGSMDGLTRFYQTGSQINILRDYFAHAILAFTVGEALGLEGMKKTYLSGEASFGDDTKNEFWDDLLEEANDFQKYPSALYSSMPLMKWSHNTMRQRGILPQNATIKEAVNGIYR